MIGVFVRSTLRDYISLSWAVFVVALGLAAGKFYIGSLDYAIMFVVGLACFSNFSFGLMGAAFELQQQRQADLFKVVQISKKGLIFYFSRYFLAKIAVIVIMSLLVYLAGVFVFGYSVSISSLFWFIGLMLYLAVLGLFLGASLSFLTTTPGGLATTTNFAMVIMAALSSLFYDTSLLPNWLRVVADNLPIDLILAMKDGGNGALNYFLLVAYLAISFVLVLLTYRWSSD